MVLAIAHPVAVDQRALPELCRDDGMGRGSGLHSFRFILS